MIEWGILGERNVFWGFFGDSFLGILAGEYAGWDQRFPPLDGIDIAPQGDFLLGALTWHQKITNLEHCYKGTQL